MQLFKVQDHNNEVEYTEDNTYEKEQKERKEIGEQYLESHQEITSKQHKTPIVEEKIKKVVFLSILYKIDVCKT